jgi:hypothetical protein
MVSKLMSHLVLFWRIKLFLAIYVFLNINLWRLIFIYNLALFFFSMSIRNFFISKQARIVYHAFEIFRIKIWKIFCAMLLETTCQHIYCRSKSRIDGFCCYLLRRPPPLQTEFLLSEGTLTSALLEYVYSFWQNSWILESYQRRFRFGVWAFLRNRTGTLYP